MVYVKSVMCDEFVPACKLVVLGHMQVCIDHPTYFQHPRKYSAVRGAVKNVLADFVR